MDLKNDKSSTLLGPMHKEAATMLLERYYLTIRHQIVTHILRSQLNYHLLRLQCKLWK